MRKDLDALLFNRFKMYRPDRSIQQGLMAFGFECGNGWFNLIWDLSAVVERILATEHSPEWNPFEFEVVQVKEKFAELRWYTNWTTPLISFVVSGAAALSAVVCDCCGSYEGKSHSSKGWLATLCPYCWIELCQRRGEAHGYKPEKLTYLRKYDMRHTLSKTIATTRLPAPSFVWTPEEVAA